MTVDRQLVEVRQRSAGQPDPLRNVDLGEHGECRVPRGRDGVDVDELGDLVDGGAGADSMAGGTGNDTYYVDDAFDFASESLGEGTTASVVTAITTVLVVDAIFAVTFKGVGL